MKMLLGLIAGAALLLARPAHAVNTAVRENPDGPNGTTWITAAGWADARATRAYAADFGSIKVGATKSHAGTVTLGRVLAPCFTISGWLQYTDGKTKDAAFVDEVGYLDENFSRITVGFNLKFYLNAPPPPVREQPRGSF